MVDTLATAMWLPKQTHDKLLATCGELVETLLTLPRADMHDGVYAVMMHLMHHVPGWSDDAD